MHTALKCFWANGHLLSTSLLLHLSSPNTPEAHANFKWCNYTPLFVAVGNLRMFSKVWKTVDMELFYTFLLSSPDPSCAQTRSSRSRRSITRQPCSKLKHLDSTWAKSLDVWLCNDGQPCHPMRLCNLCVLYTLPCYIMLHCRHYVVCMWGTHSELPYPSVIEKIKTTKHHLKSDVELCIWLNIRPKVRMWRDQSHILPSKKIDTEDAADLSNFMLTISSCYPTRTGSTMPAWKRSTMSMPPEAFQTFGQSYAKVYPI